MKGYYLFAPVEPQCLGAESGVERKVRAQHKALSGYFDCKLIILDPAKYKGGKAEQIIRRLPYTAAWRKWKYEGEFDDADFLYIRQVYHDQSFVRYLKSVKKANPKIKIIYEIPTYPYEAEASKWWPNIPFRMKETKSHKGLGKYVDRVVTFYNQEEIFGIPCIKLLNGFDFSSVHLEQKSFPDEISVISVSTTAFWHGYDRFIKGMYNYYQNGGNEKVLYHIVGNVLPEISNLIKECKLENNVVLHGRMSGKPLDEVYKKAFLGIDVLGGHRKDYPVSSSLKSREYGAYGIPFITSSPVDYLPEDYKYQLLLPYDDSPVDIQKVLDFYHGIYDNSDANEVAREIRQYAEARCDMKTAMKPVADWLLSVNN